MECSFNKVLFCFKREKSILGRKAKLGWETLCIPQPCTEELYSNCLHRAQAMLQINLTYLQEVNLIVKIVTLHWLDDWWLIWGKYTVLWLSPVWQREKQLAANFSFLLPLLGFQRPNSRGQKQWEETDLPAPHCALLMPHWWEWRCFCWALPDYRLLRKLRDCGCDCFKS